MDTLTTSHLRDARFAAVETARSAWDEFGPCDPSEDDAAAIADNLGTFSPADRMGVAAVYLDEFRATMRAMLQHPDPDEVPAGGPTYVLAVDGAPVETFADPTTAALAAALTARGGNPAHPYVPDVTTVIVGWDAAAMGSDDEWTHGLFVERDSRSLALPCPHCGHEDVGAWGETGERTDANVTDHMDCEACGWGATRPGMHGPHVQIGAAVRHAPLHWKDVKPDPYAALPTRSRDWKTLRHLASEVDGVERSGRDFGAALVSHERAERQGAAAFLSLLHRHLPRGWDYSWAMTGGGCSAWEVFRPGDPRATPEQSERAPWIWITGSGRGESSGDLSDGACVGAYLSYEDSCGGPDDDGVLVSETFTADPIAILRRVLAACAWVDARKGPAAL